MIASAPLLIRTSPGAIPGYGARDAAKAEYYHKIQYREGVRTCTWLAEYEGDGGKYQQEYEEPLESSEVGSVLVDPQPECIDPGHTILHSRRRKELFVR